MANVFEGVRGILTAHVEHDFFAAAARVGLVRVGLDKMRIRGYMEKNLD